MLSYVVLCCFCCLNVVQRSRDVPLGRYWNHSDNHFLLEQGHLKMWSFSETVVGTPALPPK